jgi:hypothetical protein
MSSVAFLGLAGRQSNHTLRLVDSVWTLNDWYRVYPQVNNPGRVYQIHGNFNGAPTLEGRYENWREEYENSAADIVSMCSLGFDKERIFQTERGLRDFGLNFFVSSLSYMFADAIWEGVSGIYIEGVHLIAGEFLSQVPGTLRNIETAREHGIEVHCNLEEEWKKKLSTIDWNSIDDLDKPYFWPGAPDPVIRVKK